MFCFWQNFAFWAPKKNPWDMYNGVFGGKKWSRISSDFVGPCA
jgi:hypothetical protein